MLLLRRDCRSPLFISKWKAIEYLRLLNVFAIWVNAISPPPVSKLGKIKWRLLWLGECFIVGCALFEFISNTCVG